MHRHIKDQEGSHSTKKRLLPEFGIILTQEEKVFKPDPFGPRAMRMLIVGGRFLS